jgi:hypothetical protein
MNRKRICLVCAVAILLLALTVAGGVRAQTSTNFNLEWHVIGGGGAPVASAHYVVNSTAGQGAASPPYSASTHYVVSGGYWFGRGLGLGYPIYVPLVLRD